jgi:hypothetical protein
LTVADRNCVVVTRGGEQRKANDRSVRKKLDSAWAIWRACEREAKPELRWMQTGNGPAERAEREQRAGRAREELPGWLETERSEVDVE